MKAFTTTVPMPIWKRDKIMPQKKDFFNLYSHGFIRAAVCIPEMKVADVSYNTQKTIELAREAAARKAIFAIFPELGISAYSNEDLFHQDAVLQAVREALGIIKKASEKINLVIKPEETPLAICTSSGTLGHSLSFGKADACMMACRSGALADAYATAFCNQVKSKDMVLAVTEKALKIPEILSVVIIMDDKVGLGGKLQIKI